MQPARTAEIRARIAAGDTDGLSGDLARIAEQVGDGRQFGPDDVVAALDDLPAVDRPRLIDALVELSADAPGRSMAGRRRIADLALFLAGRFDLDAPEALLPTVLAEASRQWHSGYDGQLLPAVRAHLAAGRPPTGGLIAVLRRMAEVPYLYSDELARLLARVDGPVLSPGEAWADLAMADAAAGGEAWERLLARARTADAAKPAKKWERTGRDVLAEVGVDAATAAILRWLAQVGRPRTLVLASPHGRDVGAEYDPYNTVALRGLVWLPAFTPESPETVRALGTLAETALRKVPGVGPICPKVANAAVLALSRLGGAAAVGELARLSVKLTYRGTLKAVGAALDTRAADLGLSRAEVEELAVPGYGLTEVGRRVERFGEATAELTVSGRTVTIAWRNAAGRVVKAPPADVRRDHGVALGELKADAKDIAKMLAAQSDRLDRLFLARRSWRFDRWRAQFLDHPLVGTLARRLLWTVDGRTCGYADGALRTLDDTAIEPAAGAAVGLWHPIDIPHDEVRAARDWLERHLITQPFRQAHREVYPLTAAEERTGTYSNRYAAHVLRQHLFHALAATRGWTNKLRLSVDDEYPPAIRSLPEWGLRAEFLIGAVGDHEITGSGSHLHIATDQVRFHRIDAPVATAHASGGPYRRLGRHAEDDVAPLPLETIPPLVFSEVMRDIDLFVGVAGIGNDPTWADGGPDGRYRYYWSSYSFGELTDSAVARRDVLARLLPRLAIAPRCELDGRYLRVTGIRRAYAIHLGSGNVLMCPGNRYLCIVPKNDGTAVPFGAFLPYEGDRTLSIILSKAVLLARDDLITDPTITSQFR
ncbi:DUF4132 domain-containing protein [Embleya sp. NPDC056575]|uniref:DUF4132 domain-containing protein n=1 Tax=unclassified Embleya TaxID=2699296 RepID=UPI00368BC0BD